MTSYDAVVVPLIKERVIYNRGKAELPEEGKPIPLAIAGLLQEVPELECVVLSGGPGSGVFYDNNGFFGKDHPSIKSPIFSRKAFAMTSDKPSLAHTFREELLGAHNISDRIIFIEPFSLFPEESAAAVDLLLTNRVFAQTNETKPKKIGVLARLLHAAKIISRYCEQGLHCEIIYIEDLVAKHFPGWKVVIENYYQDTQFNVTELSKCMEDPKRSVAELLWPIWQEEGNLKGPRVRAKDKFTAAKELNLGERGADKVQIVTNL